MEEALNLLNIQPTGFPKWGEGITVESRTDEHKHLFLFDPDEFGNGFGRVRAACQYVDGAAWIARADPTMPGPRRDHCADCMEVQLQHWVATDPSS